MSRFPFKQQRLGNVLLREFSAAVNPSELVWHRDHSDRVVAVVEGSGWSLQMDNQLPVLLEVGKQYYIPKNTYHRVIKGSTKLVLEINETSSLLLRECIRELLAEDAMGFVHDLAAAGKEFGKEGEDFYGGDPGKGGGRAIKRAFNANADHQWLSTLDTVHWTGDLYAMKGLKGKGKDELSATMTLPGEDFDWPLDYGLWIKGRITLAANNQDHLYTGMYSDFGAGKEGTEEEVAHRDKSSGRNKRPLVSKDYSRYGGLKRGNEFAEKVAKKIPYLLDRSMWAPSGNNNEALVDNWKPVGIILTSPDQIYSVSGLDYIEGTEEDIEEFALGITKQILLTALAFGVPVYDTEREMLWSPE